ncbi:WD repeat-containing protein 70 [Tripterygium wilfordii]|uniref:WD repeat-containing protein 70 n=1 Tax=Tripterygium wilfordii TaxID=458696 RepID=A0A7J7CYQ5_TRIWF|nr:WD repeat-containing protein 70 [Tripterygium wilfordii]XP_038718100.1 WD repeat-containing protein 70 [Tripterygium wilfordii]KAF5738996.1 WD repeat-containing protein 70 [Tripterygium wilfordii]
MEDEAEIYDGVRAQFPLTFGKQSKAQTSLEALHNTTRRTPTPTPTTSSTSTTTTTNGLPSLSSSSKAWLDSLRNHTPKISNLNPRLPSSDRDEDAIIGPPRPPPASGSGDDDDDGIMVGPPPPPPRSGESDEDEEEGVMIGPPRPSVVASLGESDSDGEVEKEENQYRIPMSNEIVLKGHTKVVSALAIDHSGSRVLSGSYDYMVRMYDFQGMNSRLQSFRQLEPFEGHQIRNLSWSPTSDRFLCVTGSAQAKIYDRDGLTLGEFVKGDMYIRDLKNTKGHISGLTCGEWHPKTKETILTSSEDGSLRIWDVNDFKSQKQVIKPKLARPRRVAVTTCTWDWEGKCIAGGIGDGSIQIWNLKPGWGSRPDIYVENAHSDDISGLKFSSDGKILLSRSFDGSLKVWDLRQMKEPLKVFNDLPNNYAQTNIVFSPDEQLFLTGTSVERESTTGGLLCFYDRTKLELVSKVGISPSCSVVQCAWHPKLNQVFATTGDKSQGGTHVLYDPTLSERGALVCVARAPRKKSVDDFEAAPVVHNPHALPLFRDQPSRKRQREKILKDPIKSHKPELPMTGPGHGGRVGTTQGSLLTQYLLKQGGMIKETWMEEDPREAILKYADVAAKDPKFIAPAYAQTQPEPVFAKSDSEDEDK